MIMFYLIMFVLPLLIIVSAIVLANIDKRKAF